MKRISSKLNFPISMSRKKDQPAETGSYRLTHYHRDFGQEDRSLGMGSAAPRPPSDRFEGAIPPVDSVRAGIEACGMGTTDQVARISAE